MWWEYRIQTLQGRNKNSLAPEPQNRIHQQLLILGNQCMLQKSIYLPTSMHTWSKCITNTHNPVWTVCVFVVLSEELTGLFVVCNLICNFVVSCNFQYPYKTEHNGTIWPISPAQQGLKITPRIEDISIFNGQAGRWRSAGPAALKWMCNTLSPWLSFTCLYQRSAALILLIPVNRGGAKPAAAFSSFLPALTARRLCGVRGLHRDVRRRVFRRVAAWTVRSERGSRCRSCHDSSREAALSSGADLSVRRPADCRYSGWQPALTHFAFMHSSRRLITLFCTFVRLVETLMLWFCA